MVDEPIGISISPYGADPDEPVRRPVSQLLLGAGWLIAAALAVAASFATTYNFSIPSDGDQSDGFHESIDGWGRIRVSGAADLGLDSSNLGSGPRYGVLLCLAAAIIGFGWLIQRRLLNLPRLTPHGLSVSGVGAVFLCGVVACQLVDAWPVIRRGPSGTIPLGSCLYLGAGSALLGLVTWLVGRRGQPAEVPPAAEDD